MFSSPTHLLVILQYLCSPITSECELRWGTVAYLTGDLDFLGESIAGGYHMAVHDYTNKVIHNYDYFTSHIQRLDNNASCNLKIDLRDIETDIKVAIVEIFDLSASFDECTAINSNLTQTPLDTTSCAINLPFIIGPAASGHCLTTNPLVEAFNLLQFSPSATSTFLSSYESFYRPIPADSVQATALIDLIIYFGWDQIGILYINNDYGSSLQREITSFAFDKNILVQAFPYIEGDNVTRTNTVDAMHNSNIFIWIMIVYDQDVVYITELFKEKGMTGFPYYFVGTDAWLYHAEFNWKDKYLDVYGGMIGTCPWSPSIDDPLFELYPYPLNESLLMYEAFYARWMDLKEDLLYNVSAPGLFTVYAYDSVLAIIKMIDEYIAAHDITTEEQLFTTLYETQPGDLIDEFKNILSDIWYIGISGNVSFGDTGDRIGGLFSFCNIDPSSGAISQIGFSIIGSQTIVNEEEISWPFSMSSVGIPLSEYYVYHGISNYYPSVPIIFWILILFSMSVGLMYIVMILIYRKRKIIKASQWELTLFMVCGCMVTYISLLLFGIDESFPILNSGIDYYNFSALCNIRFILLNLSFGLIYAPLFTKVHRIKQIFKTALIQMKRYDVPTSKYYLYIAIFIGADFLLSIILSVVIPYHREYRSGAISSYAITKWGSCSLQNGFAWIYFLILGVPKFVFSFYCVILSVSVFSTVNMMKFNEGIQVLICIVISILLIFITLVIASISRIDSASSAAFFYGFITLILLINCNFICGLMVLPRLASIWKGYDEEKYTKENDGLNAVKQYLAKMRKNLNKAHSTNTNSKISFGSTAGETSEIQPSQNENESTQNNSNMHLKRVSNLEVTEQGGRAAVTFS